METLPNGLPIAGQRLRLEITDLAFGGEGVGRVGEFVVFIPFTAPGDVVEAKLTEVKKSFGRAELVKVLTASTERVTPKCTYFGECGGANTSTSTTPPSSVGSTGKSASSSVVLVGLIRPWSNR